MLYHTMTAPLGQRCTPRGLNSRPFSLVQEAFGLRLRLLPVQALCSAEVMLKFSKPKLNLLDFVPQP